MWMMMMMANESKMKVRTSDSTILLCYRIPEVFNASYCFCFFSRFPFFPNVSFKRNYFIFVKKYNTWLITSLVSMALVVKFSFRFLSRSFYLTICQCFFTWEKQYRNWWSSFPDRPTISFLFYKSFTELSNLTLGSY